MLLHGIGRFCARQILCGWTAQETHNTAGFRKMVRILYLVYLFAVSFMEIVTIVDQKLIYRSIKHQSGLIPIMLRSIWAYSPSNMFEDSQSLWGVMTFLAVSSIVLGFAALHILRADQVADLSKLNNLNQDVLRRRSEARHSSHLIEDEEVPPIKMQLLRPGAIGRVVAMAVKGGDLIVLFYFWVLVELCMIAPKTYTKGELVTSNSSYALISTSQWFSFPLESYDAQIYVTRMSEAIQFGGASHMFSLLAAGTSFASALILKVTRDWLRSAFYNPFPSGQSLLSTVASVKQSPASSGELTLAFCAVAMRFIFWYSGSLTGKHNIPLDTNNLQDDPLKASVDNTDTVAYAFVPLTLCNSPAVPFSSFPDPRGSESKHTVSVTKLPVPVVGGSNHPLLRQQRTGQIPALRTRVLGSSRVHCRLQVPLCVRCQLLDCTHHSEHEHYDRQRPPVVFIQDC